jgi:hypothetical protein
MNLAELNSISTLQSVYLVFQIIYVSATTFYLSVSVRTKAKGYLKPTGRQREHRQ